jgi:hypothetical protein
MKGYISEILHPNRDFVIATEAEGKELIKKGYKMSAQPLQQDKYDSKKELYFFYHEFAKPNTLDQGIVSYKQIKGKGHNTFKNQLNNGSYNPATDSYNDFQEIYKRKQEAMRRMAEGTSKPKRVGNRALI